MVMMMTMLLFSLPFSFLLSLDDDDVDENDVVAFCSQNILHRFCSKENTNIFFLLLLPLLSSMMMVMLLLLSLLFSRTTSLRAKVDKMEKFLFRNTYFLHHRRRVTTSLFSLRATHTRYHQNQLLVYRE
jgi:hypothetical protein